MDIDGTKLKQTNMWIRTVHGLTWVEVVRNNQGMWVVKENLN